MTTSTSVPEHDHHDQGEHPHACNDGWVSMEVEVMNPETGEEILEEALYLCRLCSSEAVSEASR